VLIISDFESVFFFFEVGSKLDYENETEWAESTCNFQVIWFINVKITLLLQQSKLKILVSIWGAIDQHVSQDSWGFEEHLGCR